MGLIIWHKVEIEKVSQVGATATPAESLLTVSNDVFAGQYIVDADITLTMLAGAEAASTFAVRLKNLPKDVTDQLLSRQSEAVTSGSPLQARIHLGYFEDSPALTSPDPVMVGAVTYLKSEVNTEGILEVTLRGEDLAGHRLRMMRNRQCSQAEQATAESFLRLILANTGVDLAEGHGLTETIYNYTFDERNALEALRVLAHRIQVPVVIRDKKVFIKNSVGAGNLIATLSRETNSIQQDEIQATEVSENGSGQAQNESASATPRLGYSMVVLGDPRLRVGGMVAISQPEGGDRRFRVQHVVHRFSTSSGYTCDPLIVVNARQGELAQGDAGAHAVARQIRALADGTQHPSIDVGQVTAYESGGSQKHLANLDYGQSPLPDVAAPSVMTPVDDAVQLYGKPVASPFAWQHCGLIVPIYPGMRAVLAHNLDRPNDAVVVGFLWSENPRLEPPRNEPGDYWLCLPTELGVDNLPTGKGVNDLTDAAGLRVIQVKGMHLVVGQDALPGVGERPDVPGDLGDKLVIEHHSGSTITIDGSGAIHIETARKDISLSNGNVSLSLSGTAVEVA